VLENRVLGSNADKITVDWKRLHNEEPYGLLLTKDYAGDQFNENEMGGACGTDTSGACRDLVVRPEGK
jgi:hypothetical protein